MTDSQASSHVVVHALRVLVFLVLNYALAATSFMVVLFGVALSLGSVALCCLGAVVFQGLLYLAPLLMRLDVALHNFVEPVDRKLYGQIAHYGESESSMARPSLAVLLYFSTAKLGVGVLSAMVVIIPFSMPIHAMTSPLFRDEYFAQGWFNLTAFMVVATILLVCGFVAMPHVAKLSCITTRMVCREVFSSIYMRDYVPSVPPQEPLDPTLPSVAVFAELDVSLANFVSLPEEHISVSKSWGSPADARACGETSVERLKPGLSKFSAPALRAMLYFLSVKAVVGVLSSLVLSISFSLPVGAITRGNLGDNFHGVVGHLVFLLATILLLIIGIPLMQYGARLSRTATVYFCCERFTPVPHHHVEQSRMYGSIWLHNAA
ncbi:hypothetical protein BBJ29_008799 [Phytophthora kernoviae]|uniref:Uncharacterized protein n=1 Tax=Phytophthora kernoviae TaxID=325452 RepID=A0A3F2RD54_9STRA|nr:hypothetical protein BBJ29_008799 [Phytophthora kernoviae]RLN53621.1 hypothetical protein BBP00_00009280 [Phytophthora kernoviae]